MPIPIRENNLNTQKETKAMDANQFAGSDFMKSHDLGQNTPTIRISKVETTKFQDESEKLVIHPTDAQWKPIVLNVTNTRACIAAWGGETGGWINRTAMLSVNQTQMGPGIRVTPLQQPQQPANPNHVDTGRTDVPFDDRIPY
jgi:hypothetical protein